MNRSFPSSPRLLFLLLTGLLTCLLSAHGHAQAGSLDTTFSPGRGGDFRSVAVQSDGKIIAGGGVTSPLVSFGTLIRFNTDGSVDDTFNPGSGTNADVGSVAVQGDGKIVLGGSFTTFNGVARSGIARLNTDGSLDASFNPDSGVAGLVYSVAVQADGKIVLGGDFNTVNGVARNRIARLNADGSLDASFNPDSGVAGLVYSVAVQADGKIVLGGFFKTVDGTVRNSVARLNIDGGLDIGFNPGTGTDDGVFSVAVQADGKIVLGGFFKTVDGVARDGIARLNADGSGPADPGAVSATFDPKAGTDSTVRAIVFQPDGRALIGGAFTSYQGSPRSGVARVNADGSLDASFAVGTGADDTVNALLLQPDGKVVVGGDFSAFNGVARNGVVRLNADGSVDGAFNLGLDPGGRPPVTRAAHAGHPPRATRRMAHGKGTNTPGFVSALGVDSKGKLTVGGAFASQRGQESPFLVRALPDTGAPDPAFTPGAGAPDGPVRALVVQPDDKVVLGGLFSNTGATPRENLARLNEDGRPDADFDPGAGAEGGAVEALLVQDDGGIVLGGDFVRTGGQPRARLAKVTSKGAVDTGFAAESGGADRTVRALAPAPGGGVLVGGDFSMLDGQPAAFLSRVSASGRVDPTFNAGGGADAPVAAIAVTARGTTALVGGDFSKVANSSRSKLALIDNSAPAAPATPPFFNGGVDVGGGFSYLPSFGYYKLLPASPGYVYHNDLGFLFYIDARDGKGGAYFYDFATTPGGQSLGFFYTAPGFPFPYLYSFELGAFLYYFPDTKRGAGFYTTGPRVFVRLDTGEFLFR